MLRFPQLRTSVIAASVSGIEGINLTMISHLTGREHTMFLPITVDAYMAWANGGMAKPIQDLFPQLSPDDREFMISGATPDEWDQEFSEDEDPDSIDDEMDAIDEDLDGDFQDVNDVSDWLGAMEEHNEAQNRKG